MTTDRHEDHHNHHHRRRHHRLPVIRRPAPGTSPGALFVDPDSPRPEITVIAYGPEKTTEAVLRDPSELSSYEGKWPVLWVNVDGLGDEQVLRALAERFGIHRLALEDVVNVHQRAKVEPYESHLFMVARMIRVTDRLETEQISFFLGDGYVLTFQERAGDSFDQVRQRIAKAQGRIRTAGPDYLAWALLDALIDGYFPVLEHYAERIEALEERVLERPDSHVVSGIHSLRRELLMIRRSIWPHREAVSALTRQQDSFFTQETYVYLRDCYDHVVQLLDMVETYRELASGLLDIYLSSVSNRMNEVMKVLTVFAAIFIPLTFIAGLYGMNFKWMPELDWPWGYPMALAIMAAMAAGMLYLFRRKGWIGSPRPPRVRPDDPTPRDGTAARGD